ncbi:asparagine synthase (glutamine-hydrolyzing) [Sphingomonas koreensis]|nr:asparagine synthase (glutamine-hydrolyzing) [Sphingomonas koreensis]
MPPPTSRTRVGVTRPTANGIAARHDQRDGRRTICGIAGYFARDGAPVSVAMITAQCQTIVHRGPDDQGVMVDGDFGFGMRRLSIIDIAGGHQPIDSADRRHTIVFNGEIYNFPAMRRELAELGHTFATHSDTETILVAYQQWGDDAWARLDGMFAVAIWDRLDRRLTLARDRTGIKPLYYTEQSGGFAFASELKALLVLPRLDFTVDPRAVHDYFSYGHIRSPRSIYAEVKTLRPGHVLSIGARGEARRHAYWQPAYRPAEPLTEATWIDRFRATWLDVVKSQMLADVDVGAFLSGGVDSSAVVAAMRQVSDRPIKTFTIGFPEPRYDESGYAEAVARHLGCDHTVQMIDLGDARDVLPAIQRCYDEPFADSSAVPTWYLSKMAARDVKVALSGDGGDEIFFGYKRHLTERQVGRLPGAVRQAARGFARLPAMPWKAGAETYQRWQKTARSAGLADGATRFFAKTQITSPRLRRELFAGTMLDGHDYDGALDDLTAEYFPDPLAISHDSVEQFAMGDLALNLPGQMLTKVDRASMAHSLEVRVPMLGNALIDLALAMPAEMKLRRGVGKYVMRQAIAPWLPPGILDRRKQGFKIPLHQWFSGDLGGHVRDLWNDSGLAHSGFLSQAGFDAVMAEQRSGRRDHGRLLYAIAIFAYWWMADRERHAALNTSETPPSLATR